MTYHAHTLTPLGEMILASDGQALTGAWFTGQAHFPKPEDLGHRIEIGDCEVLTDAQAQLLEYFDGKRTTFDLPISPEPAPESAPEPTTDPSPTPVASPEAQKPHAPGEALTVQSDGKSFTVSSTEGNRYQENIQVPFIKPSQSPDTVTPMNTHKTYSGSSQNLAATGLAKDIVVNGFAAFGLLASGLAMVAAQRIGLNRK